MLTCLCSTGCILDSEPHGDELEVYRRRLVFVCLKRRVPFQDAQDVVQEALLAVSTQLRAKQFRGESSLTTWIMSIVLKKIADYWRGRQRLGRLVVTSIDNCQPEYEDFLMNLAALTPRSDFTVDVRELLERLPDEHRLVLLLNVLGGYTTAEIARLLHRSPGRTGAILADAKRRFRDLHRPQTEENLGPATTK